MSSESRSEREIRNRSEGETPATDVPEAGAGPAAGDTAEPGRVPEQGHTGEPAAESVPDAGTSSGSAAAPEPATGAQPATDSVSEKTDSGPEKTGSGPEANSGASADRAPEPVYADRCYRSPGALAGGVFLLLLAAWLGTDALLNGDSRTRLTVLSGLVLAVPLVVAFTLRPAVYASAQRMRVRNPFRTITVPWGTVEAVRSGYSSEVVAGGTKYQLWSIPVSLRARKRASRRAERAERAAAQGQTAPVPGRPTGLFGLGGVPGADDAVGDRRAPSDQAIDELRVLAADNAAKPSAQGEVTVRWAYEIAAPALVGAVALALVLGLG